MSHTNLVDYYVNLNSMVTDHKYQWSDLQTMFPFERDVIINLINAATQGSNQVQDVQDPPETDF
jgi:hypothetical protein